MLLLLLLLDEAGHRIHHSLLMLHHHQLLLLEEHLRSLLDSLWDLALGNLLNEVIDDVFGVLGIGAYLLYQALCNCRILLVDFLDYRREVRIEMKGSYNQVTIKAFK